MAEGTIRIIADHGHGFITPAHGRDDVSFHSSELVEVTMEQLHKGDRVSFTTAHDLRGVGPRALAVRRIDA